MDFLRNPQSSKDGDRDINPRSLGELDEFFMQLALEEAQKAGEEGEVPIDASQRTLKAF